VATPAKVLVDLMAMPCEGFHVSVSLHLLSQEDFDALVSAVPPTTLHTEFASQSCDYYDVAEYGRATLFGPHRQERLRAVPEVVSSEQAQKILERAFGVRS
jgi:hypothetical protein